MIINGAGYTYISDFDAKKQEENIKRGWQSSSGDYFKVPCNVGAIPCFVKRFEKPKEKISGYKFLEAIKGKKLKGLPIVYDVVSSSENDKTVYYLFQEYIEGDVLEKLQLNGFTFKPTKLGSDIFAGLTTIHEYGFWFPDFCSKNFMLSKQGDFYIIDLDSAYSLSILPFPNLDIYGSKDYWSPVKDYYLKVERIHVDEVKKIRGDLLNQLHLVYLIGLYSYFLNEKGTDLSPESISQLNQFLLKRHTFFKTAMSYCLLRDPNTNLIKQRTLTQVLFMQIVTIVLFPEDKSQFLCSKKKDLPSKINNRKDYYSNQPNAVQPSNSPSFQTINYQNGDKYVGELKNNLWHGTGKLMLADGSVFEGEWQNGKFHGKGACAYASGGRYNGNWENNKYHGYGRLIDEDGDIYEGTFLSGMKHGRGKFIVKNKYTYDGDWYEGKILGKGTCHWLNGGNYTGDWKDGNMCGFGRRIYKDGFIYEGSWKDSIRNGRGILYNPQGKKLYDGEWLNEKFHGKGILYYSDNSIYDGNWISDKRQGWGKLIYANGDVYEGGWKNDEMSGTGFFKPKNGSMIEWKDGKKKSWW